MDRKYTELIVLICSDKRFRFDFMNIRQVYV